MKAKGGATLRLQLYESASLKEKLYDSATLSDGDSVVFQWPDGQGGSTLTVRGGGPDPSSVTGNLVAIDPSVR